MDQLLGIGDFSARCGLSAKMLRSYAAAGLLLPAAVDRSSGYRYYASGQLHQARVVALLRGAGIAVADIAGFLHNPDRAQLDRWDRQILREAKGRRQALATARAALALGDSPTPTRPESIRKGPEVTRRLLAGTATHRGGRETNQDAALVGDRLFAVADGFGGLQVGEGASRLALDTLDVAFAAEPSLSGLLSACRDANEAVWRQATANSEDASMGTTLTAIAMTTDIEAVVLHIGDSRMYRFRDGRLTRLTHDHTVVAGLIQAGELSEADARTHPQRHLLTRALGVGPDVEIDHAGVRCQSGDRLVLCTDGLLRDLSGDDLIGLLASAEGPQQTADALVAKALNGSAEDNVTALIIDVD